MALTHYTTGLHVTDVYCTHAPGKGLSAIWHAAASVNFRCLSVCMLVAVLGRVRLTEGPWRRLGLLSPARLGLQGFGRKSGGG